jgi:threonine dehydratase
VNAGAGCAGSELPNSPTGTPMVASRSLGRLLGLESLHFKVECWQATGSWLDRSAAALVSHALGEGRTGLCAVGLDAWTVPLAARCARAGLRFVILEPAEAGGAAAAEPGWLAALGTRTVAVEADGSALSVAAAGAAEAAGLRLVSPADPLLEAGLASVIQEVEQAGYADALLALPSVDGGEHRWLAATALMRPRLAVVGSLTEVAGTSAAPDESLVLAVDVSPREADAARRLLAREDSLLVSRCGATGLAGLLRALREDRARRPRERRLRGVTSAVVVLTGDPLPAGGPPPEADAVSRRPVSLAALASSLARALVEPPGR